MDKPRFGDRVLNISASEDNPRRESIFCRVVRSRGRFNPGTWYECTDGNGNFWQTVPRFIQVIPALLDADEALAVAERRVKVLELALTLNECSEESSCPVSLLGEEWTSDRCIRCVIDRAEALIAEEAKG